MAMQPKDKDLEIEAGGILIKMTVQPSMGDVFDYLNSLPARARFREALYLLRVGFDIRSGVVQHQAAALPRAGMVSHQSTANEGLSTQAATQLRSSDNENVTRLYGEDLTSFLEPHS
ncbi:MULTISPECIES: hypothetical protein [unclassified Hydrogenophaga]|uniref:hypothetical protein n=1 Tax=unclassified Hydrogenophaga TaxID=2610897 RepID=UPI00131F8C34|nr:hypothetical protein [Hydrogenophaga sp. PBL-H3]QHE78630.1 hypothetical protein F9Z45_21010 [Hydrogenophaga sp. PBL-H3]QHE83055.1 hypothetical protein F9Z44_21010 [Hydrogenophaga sp. PBL-H3]